MVTFGQVTKQQYKLIETGEYVFTLNDLGEIEGDYGTRMTWDFFVAPKESPASYLARDDGRVITLKMFTDVDVTLGSRQHEWIQALAGRSFDLDADLPDGSELLSKRMVAYLTHYTPKRGKNAGVAKEDIVAGSCKPFAIPRAKTNGKTAPGQVSADPSSDEIERATIVSKLQKQTARLLKLDPREGEKAHEAVEASDLDAAPLSDLEALLNQITAAVTTALDN